MHEYFHMAPSVNIYAYGYPTTSKYHMLPIHLRGQLRKSASGPLDYMGIYKYLMGKLPNMHKYLEFWLLCKLYSVLDKLKQEKHGVTTR